MMFFPNIHGFFGSNGTEIDEVLLTIGVQKKPAILGAARKRMDWKAPVRGG